MNEALCSDVKAGAGRHAPAPRVLHIGNIANNAYLNARILNDLGYENHVVVSNYYHVMAWPEWEECSFSSDVGDHFSPRFPEEVFARWQRPQWFVQGPRPLCRGLLAAMQSGGVKEKGWRWAVDRVLRTPAVRGAHRAFRILEIIGEIVRGDRRSLERYARRLIAGRNPNATRRRRCGKAAPSWARRHRVGCAASRLGPMVGCAPGLRRCHRLRDRRMDAAPRWSALHRLRTRHDPGAAVRRQ